MRLLTGSSRFIVRSIALSVPLALSGTVAAASGMRAIPAVGEAPREGMISGSWSSGIKEIFGTAFEAYDGEGGYSAASATAPISKVWFTGSQGVLSEIYWPTIDRAQVRDAQFLVSDGKSFFFEERRDAKHEVRWVRPGVPAYVTLSRDAQNRFSIQRTVFTDPDRDAVVQQVRIVRNVPGLKFYYLHNPSLGNTPMGDTAYANDTNAPGLYAWQGDEAQAVVFSVPLTQVSAGFEGANDGYQDLMYDFHLDSHFEWARNGNVALTAALDIPDSSGVSDFTVALGFGADWQAARATALGSLGASSAALSKYVLQWERYQSDRRDLSHASLDGGTLFRSSVAVLKSLEDKTFPGGFIASPSVPWGFHQQDNSAYAAYQPMAGQGPSLRNVSGQDWRRKDNRSQQVGGYHLVWPRDLYQMATAMLSVGDRDSAAASLRFLKRIQFSRSSGTWEYGTRVLPKDGAFVQNSWVDGTPYWGGLQMDQTAYPLLLAYRLWKANAINLDDYRDMILRAANFIQRNGPWSAQERWEENFGVSPSTVAAQISALWVSGEMARALGATADADRFTATADSWNSKPGDNLESWTFTETGGLGNGKYYERIEAASAYDQLWNPNDETQFEIKNGGGWKREKDVIDGGFLELVRLGVRQANDYHVLETIHEYDQYLRVDTRRGSSFYRYTGDRYNYDDASGVQTRGMAWPILSGERGHYEMAAALESGGSLDGALLPWLGAVENFATPSHMIPEQVWNSGEFQAEPTGAATPLGWSHAEYIKMLSSRSERRVIDTIPFVAERAAYLQRTPWENIERSR